MNKLIVVTGGTKGIGKAIIEKFASEGFDIITCARKSHDLSTLKAEIEGKNQGVTVNSLVSDLSSKSDTENFLSFIRDTKRPVDVLVNNAGYFIPGQIHNEEEGTLEKMISINLYSAYNITRGLIHQMKDRREGHVFNLCSTASIIPYVNGGSYCISKFAIYGMTKVLREEMKEFDVKVTAILPGATLTASWEGVELPEDRFMKAEDVASSVWGAYSLSKNSVVEEILIRPQLGDI